MLHNSAEKNSFILILTLSFCSLLFFVIWIDDREIPEIQYCCRVNVSCIDRDVISAKEIFADGNPLHSFNVIRRKPCLDMQEVMNDTYVNNTSSEETLEYLPVIITKVSYSLENDLVAISHVQILAYSILTETDQFHFSIFYV